ncbi:tyrosine-type recombinase/integrase [Nocardia sp. alder85J]|uniref:tyrosine-type recombinase/integrase n=1 Tax=Nocardia sp. alder85J TaxID=2862949 RepID=UPI001CD7C193|nr:site-specific integrase [Nocardia sp. alder85J]MCX4097937.1 site-specific integrase [Nocardia sp. alder85J]
MNSPDLDAARLILDKLGIRPEQLIDQPSTTVPIPTFRQYIPQLQNTLTPGTLRTYSPYLRRLTDTWGDRRLDEPTPLELEQLIERTRRTARIRSNSRDGRSAAEHMTNALRYLYKHAAEDGYLASGNPAGAILQPPRHPSLRTSLPTPLLAAIIDTATTTGNDPDLDTLILRLHIETACRRSGVLNLRPRDLDPTQCLILLREKGHTTRWQPISPTLMQALLQHHHERGRNDPEQPLLRYRNGRPLTGRRYDSLWTRIGTHLPWVATQQITAHWLRHTTLTWVERHFGYAVTRAYAGHTQPTRHDATTLTYVRASQWEVAQALSALTGEPHPLVPADRSLLHRQPLDESSADVDQGW